MSKATVNVDRINATTFDDDDDDGYGGLPIVRGREAREIVQRWENTPKWTGPPISYDD